MPSIPQLSIVIPARNREATLQRTLDSVLGQTLRPLRIVLVDNGSTDATAEIMRSWAMQNDAPDFRVTVVSEHVPGASQARNRGLEMVESEYVMFFDSDDEMLPSHCADMLAPTLLRPEIDIVGRTARLVLLDGSEHSGIFTLRNPMFNHIFHSILATQRYIARTALVRNAGGWDTRLRAWLDWELGFRLLLSNPIMAEASGSPTVIVHSQPESITGTGFGNDPEKWETTLLSIRRTLLTAGRTDLLPLLDVRSIILAAKYHIEGFHDDARRLRVQTLDLATNPAAIKAIYRQHLLMRHGSAGMASILFPYSRLRASRRTACTPPSPSVAADAPQLTVVIPVWNRQSTLRRTLNSVSAQTLRPLKVVLVDNRSTDSSRAIMEEWMQINNRDDFRIEVLSENRRGASSARNCGLKNVTTPYVMFCDSDDDMLPTHCADIMATAAASPEAEIIGRPTKLHMLNGPVRQGLFTTGYPIFNHIFHSILATNRYIVKTSTMRSVGAWNEHLWAWEDWELGFRMLLKQPKMARCSGKPSAIVYSRPDSVTGTCFSHSPAKWEDALDATRRLFIDAGHEDMMVWLDARTLVLAARYHREGAYTEARRLKEQVISRTPHPRRMKLLFLQHRLMGRGTAVAARLLFPFAPRR